MTVSDKDANWLMNINGWKEWWQTVDADDEGRNRRASW